ncbi:ABC transporter substrate-binding protein [Paenibacillus sp. J5C_2022]|uniref:ABC transporter substrate-binding protein n=1 Tax=Paenibacillus sp. J5C2022 TaxID=2977129 RepID=UPI0021CFD750|nr:ABC transporter substrate-binding protein [Paenibacillus sp. J5C2022]MCU6711762.1 ABC transporter substrate-binding protein [Paenibacillus sp. J5C2022]
MKLRRHYAALRRAFPGAGEQEPIDTTTGQLASIVDCTQRNMVILLRRMEEEGWLSWQSNRGRGKRSQLLFLASLDAILLQQAKEHVQKQDLASALRIIQELEEPGSRLQEQFREWLSGQFGFRSEVEGKKRLDVLRFPLPQRIDTLDPAAIHYIGESHLVNQLFDGLVAMDSAGGTIMPHLAHAWESDAERTTWTFYLRKGVSFHHGREMTSDDVVYSLKRLQRLAPDGLYSWVYNDIAEAAALDETTVRIRLKRRNETFLSFLTTNRASIVPEDLCEADGGCKFGSKPVGTGPFRLLGSERGVWTLDAFLPYFRGRAFLDRVEVWTMPDTVAGEREENEPPHARTFQVMHNARLQEGESGQWRQVRQSGTTCKFIAVNEIKRGPLASPDVRAILNRAIHRPHLLGLLAGDVIEASSSFWIERSDEMPMEEQGAGASYDIGQLRRELAQSSYAGQPLSMMTISQYAADASLIAELLEETGFAVTVSIVHAGAFKGAARMEADLLLFATMLDEHRELRLIDLYKSMQQHMPPTAKDSMERSLQCILSEPDVGKRRKQFIGIERQLRERHSLLFLYRKALKTAFHPAVRGIALESLGWVRFRDLWFKQE